MKLHNKDLDEIFEVITFDYANSGVPNEDGYYPVEFITIEVIDEEGDLYEYNYKSLKDLNTIWEDYTQTEPLIKDEKIRKAVRAWAEVNGVKKVEPRGVGDTLLYFIGEDKGKKLIEIEFYANVDDYTHLASKDTYTIAELCGEEEE